MKERTPSERSASRQPHRRWRRCFLWLSISLLTALAALAGVFAVLLHRAEPYLRARIVAELAEHFHARVELDSFHISLLHGLWAEGRGLRIQPLSGQPADAPLIQLDEFRFHTPLHLEPGKPLHIAAVQLKGLRIDLPPQARLPKLTGSESSGNVPKREDPLLRIEVETINCTNAMLTLETGKPGKEPLVFAIDHLQLTGVNSGGAMGFEAQLTNPRPVGAVHTTGSFGPWQADDPEASPIAGNYQFDHADLSTFKGIAGTLTSAGSYQGTLRSLDVSGSTETPDFRLTHFGNQLPLHTVFQATVDTTNGDTVLHPVDATLGHSHFIADGTILRVVENQGKNTLKGHEIALNISVDRGRIEDFLRLAGHSESQLLAGAITAHARLQIPPGREPLHLRLALGGSFALDQARFTSAKIQDKIEQLSLRGQGEPGEIKETDPSSVRSAMKSDFTLQNGTLNLPNLVYTVPGATIQLVGSYALDSGALNFAGTAKTEATISQMVGGWKGLLLKPADRYFKKEGAGVAVPVQIRGTRENPAITLDFDRLKATFSTRSGAARQ